MERTDKVIALLLLAGVGFLVYKYFIKEGEEVSEEIKKPGEGGFSGETAPPRLTSDSGGLAHTSYYPPSYTGATPPVITTPITTTPPKTSATADVDTGVVSQPPPRTIPTTTTPRVVTSTGRPGAVKVMTADGEWES